MSDNAIERIEMAVDTGRPVIEPGDLEIVTGEIHRLHQQCAALARQFRSALFHAEHLAIESRHVIESAQSVGASPERMIVPSRALHDLEKAIHAEEDDIHQKQDIGNDDRPFQPDEHGKR